MKNQSIVTGVFVISLMASPGCSDSTHGSTGKGQPEVILGSSDAVIDAYGSLEDSLSADTFAGEPADSNTASRSDVPPNSNPDVQASKTDPQIVTVPEEHSFSFISPLTAAMFKQVTIHNLGSAPLEITAISFPAGSSPDFDMVLIPPLPKTVPPNKSTMVNVRFREIAGGNGTLRIESNDPARPVVDIPLSSNVKATVNVPEPCVAITPSQLNFGTVVRGQKKTMQAKLSNCGSTEPLTLKKIVRSATFFFGATVIS